MADGLASRTVSIGALVVVVALCAFSVGCRASSSRGSGSDSDAGGDTDTDIDSDSGTDSGTDPGGESTLGYEFWAVTLSNTSVDFDDFDFAVVVINPSETTATVQVSDGASFEQDYQVPAGEALVIDDLPWIEALAAPGDPSTGVWASRRIGSGAYRLVSDQLVAAYQVNPLQNVANYPAYSNSVTQLLPVTAQGEEYLIVSRPTMQVTTPSYDHISPGLFALVGAADGPATLEVTPGGATVASDDQSDAEIPAYLTGDTFQLTIGPHDVVQMLSAIPVVCPDVVPCGFGSTCCDTPPQFDLTGTSIRVLDGPSPAVFGGTDGSFVPFDVWCADHLEVQLPPVESWGTAHVCAHPSVPETPEPAVWRVVSGADGNQLTFEPASVHDAVALDRGEYVEFESSSGFVATSSEPSAVVQFSVGSEHQGSADWPTGDPAMAVVPPVERHATKHVFFAPEGWHSTYVVAIHPSGVVPLLDEAGFGSDPEVIAAGYSFTSAEILPGLHHVTADEPVAVMVRGAWERCSYLVSATALP